MLRPLLKSISVVNYIANEQVIAKKFVLFHCQIEMDTQNATVAFGSLHFKKINIGLKGTLKYSFSRTWGARIYHPFPESHKIISSHTSLRRNIVCSVS